MALANKRAHGDVQMEAVVALIERTRPHLRGQVGALAAFVQAWAGGDDAAVLNDIVQYSLRCWHPLLFSVRSSAGAVQSTERRATSRRFRWTRFSFIFGVRVPSRVKNALLTLWVLFGL